MEAPDKVQSMGEEMETHMRHRDANMTNKYMETGKGICFWRNK